MSEYQRLTEPNESSNKPTSISPQGFSRRSVKIGLATVIILSLVAIIVLAVVLSKSVVNPSTPLPFPPNKVLYEAIDVTNIMGHLSQFQDIAYKPQNRGSRSVVNGYADSANYVIQQLQEKTDCEISTQNFLVPIYDELAPPVLQLTSPYFVSFQRGIDFSGTRYGGNMTLDITVGVFNASYGCDAQYFTGIPPDSIAFIQVGASSSNDPCYADYITKAMNAQNAGARAVVFFNDNDRSSLVTARVRGPGWLPGDPLVSIPTLTATYSVGTSILSIQNPLVRLSASTSIKIVETFNVFCETKEGNPQNTIIIGSHLDSVPEGPGINDNGSGSATVLELVIQWYALKLYAINKIRFCWWGGEELGLLGSRHYVNDLRINNIEGWNNITLALNLDMVGSPNYVPGIHDGNANVNASAKPGSLQITKVFTKFYNMTNIPPSYTGMGGGSDYFSFIEAGTPGGGLAAGAGALKTMNERTIYGGLASAAYDPCYHIACDTLENINLRCLEELSTAAAFTLQYLALLDDLRFFLSSQINP